MRPRRLLPLAILLASTPLSHVYGRPQTATADVNCAGQKVGKMTLTVERYNFSRMVGGAARR